MCVVTLATVTRSHYVAFVCMSVTLIDCVKTASYVNKPLSPFTFVQWRLLHLPKTLCNAHCLSVCLLAINFT